MPARVDKLKEQLEDLNSIRWSAATKRTETAEPLNCAFCRQQFMPESGGAATFIDTSRTFMIWLCPACEAQSDLLTKTPQASS